MMEKYSKLWEDSLGNHLLKQALSQSMTHKYMYFIIRLWTPSMPKIGSFNYTKEIIIIFSYHSVPAIRDVKQL